MAPRSPEQRRRNQKGCVIALGVIGGLATVLAVLMGVAIYRAFRDPEVRQAVSFVKEGMSISLESLNAPGADQLRDAGCTNAYVLDGQRLGQLREGLSVPGQAQGAASPPVIGCQVGSKSNLDCPTVVQVYVRAVSDAPETMMVFVQEMGFMKQEMRCGGIFHRDGTLMKELSMPPDPSISSESGP